MFLIGSAIAWGALRFSFIVKSMQGKCCEPNSCSIGKGRNFKRTLISENGENEHSQFAW